MMLQRLDMRENTRSNDGGGGGGVATMSVLERQQVTRKWQQEELQPPMSPQLVQMAGLGYFSSGDQLNMFSAPAQAQHFHGLIPNDQNLAGLMDSPMNPSVQTGACNDAFGSIRTDNGFGFGALKLGNVAEFGMNYAVSKTTSCPPAVAAALAEAASAATTGKEVVLLPEKLSSSAGRGSFKKRKADKPHAQKGVIEEESKDKKLKGCTEDEDAKVTEQKSGNAVINNNTNNTEPSETSTKENSKVAEVQKPDYIHVRARRGQATDSHSLAERVRREKISERMKFLQDLVPGCDKITGKAGMLDEIINYVQSLQRQVEFLSMKLAAVNPRLDLEFDDIFAKQVYPIGTSELHRIEESSEMNNPPNYHFDSLPQVVSGCGLEIDMNPPDLAQRAPVSMIPEPLLESPYFSQIQPSSTWDVVELQNLYALEFQQEKSTLLLSQQCTGFIGGSDVKIEM